MATDNNKEDLVDREVNFEPSNASEKVCHMIYTYVQQNREAFELPVGTQSVPYFYVSNDLTGKFASFMSLSKEKGVLPSVEFITELIDNLEKSYDDEPTSGCCSFWHSLPKSDVVQFKQMLAQAVNT